MKKIYEYLSSRQKSYIYYTFGKQNINFSVIKYVLLGILIFSIVISTFLFYALNTNILTEISRFYFFIVLVLFLLNSGLGKSMVSSDKKVMENNDLNFLLTKPISARALLLAKYFERIILTEIFLTVHIFIGIGMYLYSLGINPFVSLILSLNLIIGLYVTKVSIFSLSFVKPALINVVIFILSLSRILFSALLYKLS